MRRVGWVFLALAVAVSYVASAETDCGCGDTVTPTCYETYRSNEIIDFELVVPVEYFWIHNVSIVPLITAWWVETPAGEVVKYVPFVEPKGHWATFTWDMSLDAGGYAEPGFYRIVVETTYDEHVAADIEIVSCCSSLCYGCCPSLCCGCSTGAHLCRPCCGDLYLRLESAGTRKCCGFSVSIQAVFGCSCP
jgi:hypothetical protein